MFLISDVGTEYIHDFLYGYSYAEVKSMFSEGFTNVCIDRYITTYEGGRYEQNDWLVTLKK